jgi:hypothetical protein
MRPGRWTLPIAAAAALYLALLRRRILTWGATEVEAAERLPGDEPLEDADGVATRSDRHPCAGGANRMDRIGMVPMEAASVMMERKILRGIKRRAERFAQAGPGA